jgi:5-methylcytosine-specific restriction protein A
LRAAALTAASPVANTTVKQAKTNYYQRSAAGREYVLARARGICEACEAPAPSVREDGTPYLEPHHTRRLSDGGPDHPRWVAAVCPNCHARCHHGQDGQAVNAALQARLGSLEASV